VARPNYKKIVQAIANDKPLGILDIDHSEHGMPVTGCIYCYGKEWSGKVNHYRRCTWIASRKALGMDIPHLTTQRKTDDQQADGPGHEEAWHQPSLH
jgi:hypothetical protein